MKKLLVVLGIAFAGCGHEQATRSAQVARRPTADHAPRQVAAAKAQAQPKVAAAAKPTRAAPEHPASPARSAEHVVSELCDGHDSSPSEQTITLDGRDFRQPCGLVALDFHDAAFGRFATVECKEESAEKASVECYRRWYGAFISRVLQRYTYADLQAFPFWCEAHSAECDDLRSAELWFLNSHSSGVRSAYDAYVKHARAR